MESTKISIPVSKEMWKAIYNNARNEDVTVEQYMQRRLRTSEQVNPLRDRHAHTTIITVRMDERYYAKLCCIAGDFGMEVEQVARLLLTTEAHVKKPTSARSESDSIGDGNVVNPTIAPHVANAIEGTQISKYHTKGGHGFAAEDANTLADQMRGRHSKVVGQSNELRGPDRVVDGMKVQSKYWSTAAASVNAAFNPRTGKYRYSGQVLEVPKDQYAESVRMMGDRIRQGKVPGVTDPNEASNIVKPGSVTYKQARNIARAGNIDSLVFDAKRSCIESSSVFGISFVISFAQAKRGGMTNEEAVREALKASIASSVNSVVASVVSRQLLRTRAAAIGAVGMRSGVRAVYGTSAGRATIHAIAKGSLGKSVHGAAAINHVSKLLRSNIVTAAAVAAITAGPDFYRAAFDRSISWRQFLKNTAVNVAGIAGGVGGWIGGAAVGAAVGSAVPGVGTVAGGIIGGVVGGVSAGLASGKVAKKVADGVVDDDSKILIEILNDEIPKLASEYMLTEDEVDSAIQTVQKTITAKWLRKMFKESNKGRSKIKARRYVRREFEPVFQRLIDKRVTVTPPSVGDFQRGVRDLIEEVGLSGDVAAD